MQDLVEHVVSFNYEIEEGKLRVMPAHKHDCKDCDSYLCKKLSLTDYINKNKNLKLGLRKRDSVEKFIDYMSNLS